MLNGNAKPIRPISTRRKPNRTLTSLRLNSGLSPNQLAFRAEVSGPTVRLAERGHVPSPRVQFQIAEVFGLTPLDLWPLENQKEFASV